MSSERSTTDEGTRRADRAPVALEARRVARLAMGRGPGALAPARSLRDALAEGAAAARAAFDAGGCWRAWLGQAGGSCTVTIRGRDAREALDLTTSGAPTVELMLYGDIGEDPWAEQSIGARDVVELLAAIPESSCVLVRINSYGGSVADGLAIHNALAARAPTMQIDGVAFSIASLIAMAGHRVSAAENALMMIHAPWGATIGNARDHRAQAETLDRYAAAMATSYKRRVDGELVDGWLADGEDHYLTASEALELGLVDELLPAAPADLASAIARSATPAPARAIKGHVHAAAAAHMETESMTDVHDSSAAADTAAQAPVRVSIDAARAQARAEELERVRAIAEIARMHPQIRESADQAIADGTALGDFRAAVIPRLANAKPIGTGGTGSRGAEIGAEPREIRRYSILRAIAAIAAMKEGGPHWSKGAPLEHEMSVAVSEQLDRPSKGFWVPYDVQSQGAWRSPHRIRARYEHARRVMGAAPMDTTENAALVATQVLAESYIEALRAASIVSTMGAVILDGLTGNVDVPRTDTAAAFTWLAEDGSSANTELVTGTVALSPKTLSGSVPITRRLMKQSSVAAEQLVRDDLTLGAALTVDTGALVGTGASNQPTGVTSAAGVGTVTIVTPGQPTWANLVEFESDVAVSNGLRGSLHYVMRPEVVGFCKSTEKATGNGRYLVEANECNGYPAIGSTLLAANGIIFGNFSEILIGMWGGLDLTVDTSTDAAKGGVVIRAFQDIDIGIRHGASFSKNA